MIALDTNVLVRFLVDDDRAQAERASRLIRKSAAADTPLYVPDVVLCETVWVLSSGYGVSRADITRMLSDLLRARALQFSSSDRIARSLAAFALGKGDFADYLIREEAKDAGCDEVATFDRALLKESGFREP